MEILYQNLLAFDRYDLIMIGIGCLLVYLAIVAYKMNKPLNELRFISIKEVE